MRIEILLIIGVSIWLANIYTDGRFFKQAMSYKKYYQMAGIVFGAFSFYLLFKKSPKMAHEMLYSTNEYVKYMPIDKKMVEPFLNFTKDHSFQQDNYSRPIMQVDTIGVGKTNMERKHKRAVSESKKKYIASKQNWRCAKCNELLQATYEVDHIVRLEYGGSNELHNLQALCRNCHGMKTMTEAL